MPGCAALNCTNSAKKGFLMKIFPRDPSRRDEWLSRMKRDDNWKPTKYSCLCEVHFAPEMWEKTREDGKRLLKSNAVPTIFSSNEIDNEYLRTEPNIEEDLDPEKIKSEIFEPAIKEGEAILVESPQKVIFPDLSASTVCILNTPVNIKNSSTLLQAVKTLDISKLSTKPNNSWFTKAVTAVSKINTSLSYSMTELDKAKSRATNAEELAMIHKKLQETLSGSINSLIQIRRQLRSDFILDIKTTKFPPDNASDNKGMASSVKKRKYPEFTLNPAKGLMTQKPPFKMRMVQGNSTRTTSHSIPARSPTTPATSNTIPATSHTKTKGYLKVRSFRQLQNVPSSYINLPEVTNKAEKDPLEDEYNIVEEKSEVSKDIDEPKNTPSNLIVDNVTHGARQIYQSNTVQIEQEGNKYTEISDESEDNKIFQIKQNEIGKIGKSEEKVGSNSEQNELEDLSKCDENFIDEVEVKSEPEEDLCSVDSCSIPNVVNV